ncbi:hypothetical protein D4Z93_01420 [Clostridium fermenticellae]|uniref:M24 family metallopeptidase n=1 Tax=Clostridium fermenticellae TaxID=2068654 RepID=A0A386H136_9CLOT|nr:hypothetical protein D4Z93_01420 [Clostridium fermenticellae]
MIILKDDNEIEFMRHAGKVVADTLLKLEEVVKPGITTAKLDKIAEEYIKNQGINHLLKVILNGYQRDAARTFPVGNITKKAQKLIDVTKQSFLKVPKWLLPVIN